MSQVFIESRKHANRQPNLTRKQLREYSYTLARLYLPKELEDYLLVSWFGVRKSIVEYARIKRQMDELLGASDYLGNCSLTIKVQNKPEFKRWSNISDSEQQTLVKEGSGDIPF